MKTLTILGTRPKGHPFPAFSWLIRLVEWSKISHVGVLINDRGTVFDAHFNDIEYTLPDKYFEKHKVIEEVSFQVTEEEETKVIEYFDSIAGRQKGYFNSVFGVLVPQIVRGLSCGLINLPNFGIFGHKGMSCSMLVREMVARCLKQPRPMFINTKIDKYNYTTSDAMKLARTIAA